MSGVGGFNTPAPMPVLPDISGLTPGEQAQILAAYSIQMAAYYSAFQQNAPAPAAAPAPPPPKAMTADPQEYSGNRAEYEDFLMQCQLRFASCPTLYQTDRQKIVFAGSFLRNQAKKWFKPHVNINNGEVDFPTWPAFTTALGAAFDDPDHIATAEHKLKKLKQGRDTASGYHAQFVALATVLDLTERAKISQFREGLSKEVRQLLTTQVSPPTTFDEYVNMVIRLDNNVRLLKQEEELASSASPAPKQHPSNKGSGSTKSNTPAPPKPSTTAVGTQSGPMDTSNTRRQFRKLTAEEKKYRRDNNLCSYCGGDGHYANACPKKPTQRGNSAVTTTPAASPAPPVNPPAPTAQVKASGATLYSVAAQQPLNSGH